MTTLETALEQGDVAHIEPRLHHVAISNVVPSSTAPGGQSIADLVKLFASTTTVPSKRTNKNASGRTGVKQHHARQAMQRVGGIDMSKPWGAMRAIYADPSTKLCRTYEEWRATDGRYLDDNKEA